MPDFVCPTCQSAFSTVLREDAPHRPFCSYRCKMVDLARWFNEEYRVEAPLQIGQDDGAGDDADHAN